MIVSSRPEGVVLVLQTDHQEQCAAMARAWGNDQFRRLDHWDDIQAAAGLHDEGWRAWEAEHPPDQMESPVDFVDVDREVHVEIYRRGIAAAEAYSDRAGLLVSMHGSGLYERRFGLGGTAPPRSEQPQAVQDFLNEEERRREETLSRLGSESRAWSWAAYRLLQAWDALSLYLVWRALPAQTTGTLIAVSRGVDDVDGTAIALEPRGSRGCILEPWPFQGVVAVLPVWEKKHEPPAPGCEAQETYRVEPA